MSQQRYLPESMAWRVIGRLESGKTQRSVADAVGVARSVVARLWNRFQEKGNVRRRPEAGRPRATTSTDDRYIQLKPVETEQRMLRSCKDSCSWQQDEGCPAKLYVIGFMREGSMHVGQWSAFR
ncbi:hypothetical protein TNCV_1992071 [Trichonephila clavipes]|nr:hypothetical protein TNCV_1992071 [Trichonephila clavipes]